MGDALNKTCWLCEVVIGGMSIHAPVLALCFKKKIIRGKDGEACKDDGS